MKKAKKALTLLLCMIMVMSSLYVSGNLSFLINGLNANAMPVSKGNLKNSQNAGEVLANDAIDPQPHFTPETFDVLGAKGVPILLEELSILTAVITTILI